MNKLGRESVNRGVQMKGSAISPGTCGELVQGTLDNINFHITCPVNCFTKITVEIMNDNQEFIYINEPKRKKVLQAVLKTMVYLTGKKYSALVTVNSQLPVSKGMASSTADISAACLATARALNCEISPHEVGKISLSIEPSDGLFFPGIVAFDHVKGNYYQDIGEAIDIDLLVYDFGGEIDTIVFNQRPDLHEKNYINEPEIKKALNLVEKGIKTNNPHLVAQGASISALANQNIIYKPQLKEIIELIQKAGAYGINTAHSGTLIGILLNKAKTDSEKLVHMLKEQYPHLSFFGFYKLINGGVTIPTEEDFYCSRLESMVVT